MKNFFKIIFANFHIKLLAIVAAAGVWIYAINTGIEIDTLETTIPVQVFNLDSDLALASDLPDIQVQVRAPEAIFGSLSPDDFTAFVDLADFTAGTYTVESSIVTSQPDVQVVGKTPQTFSVVIESKTDKELPVTVRTSGELAENFGALDPQVDVESVVVTGAASIVKQVKSVVANVVFRGEDAEITQTVRLEAVNADGDVVENIRINPSEASVTIPIESQNESKTVSINATTTGTPADGFAVDSITTSPQAVTITGSTSTLEGIENLDTTPIEVDGATETITRTATINVPEGVELDGDGSVSVTVKIVSTDETKTIQAPVLFLGLSDNLTVSSQSVSAMDVDVTGSPSAVADASASNVQVEVNLRNRTAGTFTITLNASNVALPGNLSASNLQPKTITVTLSAK